jgi:DedD protein
MATQRRRQSGDTVEIALEKGQVTTVLVGSVVALGVVFLLGVAFGSRLAVAEEPGEGATQIASAEPAGAGPELTFHDALTSRRATRSAPAEPEVRAAAEPAAQAATAAAVPAATAAPAAEAPAAAPEAPAPEAAPPAPEAVARAATQAAREATTAAAAPAEARPEPAKGPVFTVQVASSRDEKDTERLADRLKAAGLDARVVAADIEGRGRWYRVRVGRYETRDEAMRKQARIQLDQGLSGLVVAEQ